MSNDDILTDDYVAGLLAKDAGECSIKYSAMGMEAFRSNKKPDNKPKPNTRFLKHIIKDTNTHNKALLAKEEAESKARLEGLEQAEEAKRLRTNPNTRDIRRRQLGDIAAILGNGGRRNRRRDGDEDGRSGLSEGSSSTSKDRRAHSTSNKDDLITETRGDSRHHGRLERDAESNRAGRSRHGERHAKRRDSDSEHDERRSKHRSRRDRDRSRSPGRRHRRDCHLSRSCESKQDKYRDRSPTSRKHGDHGSRRSKRSPSPRRHHRARSDSPQSDADISDDMIGPMPAPKPRGRGALSGSSGMDRRFSESYDPTTDVQMDNDDGDTPKTSHWDDAVEAFRDRQKLKQNQEARLRSAGFAESHIEKMQAAARGTERSEADVQWAKAGERREWDKGKVSEDEEDQEPLTLLGEDV